MNNVKIDIEKINSLVAELGTCYQNELAKLCFGRATAKNIRVVKYWRSGKMVDKYKVQMITNAAEKLVKQRKKALKAA